MRWKPSRYNLRFSHHGNVYLFNTMTGALVRVDPSEEGRISALLNEGGTSNLEPRPLGHDPVVLSLKRGGFIARSDFDELAYVRYRDRLARFSNNELILAVCPTTRCNLNCSYCYETFRGRDMTDKVAESIVRFISRSVGSVKRVCIAWYGGEPMLAFDMVRRISEKAQRIAMDQGAAYASSMISNGYDLTPEKIEALRAARISAVQITLDGYGKIHDLRRPHVSGGGTFDRILGNTLSLAHAGIELRLRVNIDQENWDRVPGFLEHLASLGLASKGVVVGIARVVAPQDSCVSASTLCLTMPEFAKLEASLTRLAWELGFMISGFARPVLGACAASGINRYMVSPEGLVYNCWHELGQRSLATGRITQSGVLRFDPPNLLRWLQLDATMESTCSTCGYLPMCMGSCLYRNFQTAPRECSHLKYAMTDKLKLAVDMATNQRRKGVNRDGVSHRATSALRADG
jgi:uncharacterized protein